MSRPNYIDFAELLYHFNPEFEDAQVLVMMDAAFRTTVSILSLDTWKSKLRKKGLKIPDRRKTKGESNVR